MLQAKNLLAYIDLDLGEILKAELRSIKSIEKQDILLQEKIEYVISLTEKELNKQDPDLDLLEVYKIEYTDLMLKKYDLQKQYLIAGETIAMIELEEI